jgi:hypothetical protein
MCDHTRIDFAAVILRSGGCAVWQSRARRLANGITLLSYRAPWNSGAAVSGD